MADGLISVANQFSGLDMAKLIGGPLKAACDAEMMLARMLDIISSAVAPTSVAKEEAA